MTVCVAVKVRDCIVFSADSAATLTSGAGVLNVYNNADKVFNLNRKLPIVSMTCGMGHIGSRSISSLAKELRHCLSSEPNDLTERDFTIQEVVEYAHSFLDTKYLAAYGGPQAGHYLEFWIGGFGSQNDHGEVWKIVILDGTIQNPQRLDEGEQGIFWGGQGEAIARLVLGIDPEAVNALAAAGLDRGLATVVFDEVRNRMEKPLVNAVMPVIDAIRAAEFLVEVTKTYFSLAPGADIVGGAADIATVTKWEGFKWIKRKHFYPESLNRRDIDHVR